MKRDERGRYGRLGLVAAFALLAGCETPETVSGSNWAGPGKTPAGAELTPERAIRENVAGWAVLRCVLGADATATNCFVLAETPEGWGFGQAALRASAQTRVRNADHFAGAHVPGEGEVFNLPIVFCPPAAGPSCPLDTRAKIAAFNADLSAVQAALRAGDCPGAIAQAERMNLPSVERRVRNQCMRPAAAPPTSDAPQVKPGS